MPMTMANAVAIRTAPSIDSRRLFTSATTSDTRMALIIGSSRVRRRSSDAVDPLSFQPELKVCAVVVEPC